MKRSSFALVLGMGWLLGVSCAEPSVVAPGAKVEKLAGDFEFTEGPTCDAEGNLFFTDRPNDRILKWSVAGKLFVSDRQAKQPAQGGPGRVSQARGSFCFFESEALFSAGRTR